VPSTILDARDIALNKTDNNSSPYVAEILVEER
jgi:hypothetical protein